VSKSSSSKGIDLERLRRRVSFWGHTRGQREDVLGERKDLTLSRSCPAKALPDGIENENSRHSDVGSDEVLNIPVVSDEDLEAVEEGNEHEEDERNPGGVGLPGRLVWERVPVDALSLHTVVEPKVGEEDDDPGDDSSDRRDVVEPVEDLIGAVASEGHVSQGAEDNGSDRDGVDGESSLGADSEEGGSLAFESEGVEDSGRSVDVRVSGRPDGNQKNGVDYGGKSLDTSSVDGDDEGRLRDGRTVRRVEEVFVVVGNEESHDENGGDVENQDPPERSPDGLGDVLSGVLGLTTVWRVEKFCQSEGFCQSLSVARKGEEGNSRSEGNDLSTEEREGSADESGPESDL
jgi:hypothetical protein